MSKRNRLIALKCAWFTLALVPLMAQAPVARKLRNIMHLGRHVEQVQSLLGADHTFQLGHGHQDSLGQSHVHFHQWYRGVRVWGGAAITHLTSAGQSLPMTDALHGTFELNVTPTIDPTEALGLVMAKLPAGLAFSVTPVVELVVLPQQTEVIPSHAGSRRLEPNALDVRRQALRDHLAWYIQIEGVTTEGGPNHTDLLLDAHTGGLLRQWNALRTRASEGSGRSQYSGLVTLSTTKTAGGYELRDLSRGQGRGYGANAVVDAHHSTSTTPQSERVYSNLTDTWGDGANYVEGSSTTGDNGQTAAVDAMYGMTQSWDFYKNVFGRNGIDDEGTATFSRVHFGSGYDNAFWSDSCFCMTYGDGSWFSTLTALDVAGHELSHGVCSRTANLDYFGESGGLNEANSDIFGTLIEFYARNASGIGIGDTGGNFTIGEQLSAVPLRYMYKPSLDGTSPNAWCPNLGTYDVHYSSGPMNRCFYFMSRGATTDGDTQSSFLPEGMPGIGNDRAAAIWYRTLTTYLTSTSNYSNARAGAIRAAIDLYGAGGEEEQAVWNAFAAINVGNRWTPAEPAILSQPTDAWVTAGGSATFKVSVTGVGPMSYQWKRDDLSLAEGRSATYTLAKASMEDHGSSYSVVVSNALGSVTSTRATLNVGTAPAITAQPVSLVLALGKPASFTVETTGSGPMRYQWRRNGLDLPGATFPGYTTPPTTLSDQGATYSVMVSNGFGSVVSASAKLTLGSAPTLTSPPMDIWLAPGSLATFKVVATGTGTMTCQWKRNGLDIPGATSTTYTVSKASAADDGVGFTATLTNPYGTLATPKATLHVGWAPRVTTQPLSATVLAGSSTRLTVTCSGSAPLTFAWKVGGVAIPATDSAIFQTPPSAPNDNAKAYTVTITNGFGTTTSSAAILTVGSTPVVTSQPADARALVGKAASFKVVASGTGPLSYQWRRNGTDLPGATLATYTLTATKETDQGSLFTVTVSNGLGRTASTNAVLQIGTPPRFTTQPISTTALVGSSGTFTVACAGSGPLSYQWSTGGRIIPGATAASYTTPPIAPGDNAKAYLVSITNGFGSITSNTVFLIRGTAPSVTSQPVSPWVIVGRAVTFTVIASGTGPLTYQWKRDGLDLPGATSSTFTISKVGLSDNGSRFGVTISSSLGSVASEPATLNVGTAPSITTQPANAVVIAGKSASFSVTCTGSSPLTYQWRLGGIAIPGANGSTYSGPIALAGDNVKSYTVTISNGYGSITSTAALLSVGTTPTITTPPVDVSVTAGKAATFRVVAAGSPALRYQWRKNSVNLPGATLPSYTIPKTGSSDSNAVFTVTVTNALGTITSSTAKLTVN